MKILERLVLPLLILVLGVVCAGGIIAMKPKADRSPATPKVAAVEVLRVQPAQRVVQVHGTGVVGAAQQIALTPEVGGRLARVSDAAIPGGRLRKGEPFAWIDARDLEAALAAEQARLAQAELELALETQRGEAARREWALLGQDKPEAQAELALRRVQLQVANANVASVRASVERAQRNVQRAVVTAPFDALVVSESVDVGQIVGAGSVLAQLVGTRSLWVPVSVPVDKLGLIDVPGFNAEVGSTVMVTQQLGDGAVTRTGRVLRLGGQLDPQTRTAVLIVAVDDPLDPPEGQLPLLPGAYVDVDIAGRALEQVFEVPRAAVFDGDSVWVVDGEERLSKRGLRLVWSGPSSVYAREGLVEGDRVVVTPLGLPVPGMPVKATAAAPAEEG